MKDMTHERFASGLEDAAAKTSIKELNEKLIMLIDLQLSVKQAHWTVRGTNFIGVHELLDRNAANLVDLLDKFAERCMIIGGVPAGISQVVAKETKLPEYPVKLAAVEDHVKELTKRYKMVAEALRDGIDTVSEGGDEDTADLFTEASRVVDKDCWFIGSNIAPKA